MAYFDPNYKYDHPDFLPPNGWDNHWITVQKDGDIIQEIGYFNAKYNLLLATSREMHMVESSIRKWSEEGKNVGEELKVLFPIWGQQDLPPGPVLVSVPAMCQYCHRSPCCSHDIYDLLSETGTEMEEEGSSNRIIRFALYRLATEKIHGNLGKGNRKELPACITGEIRDLYSRPRSNYIGYCEGSGP